MRYALPAVERAMRVQEVMLRAMSGELSWLKAADILGMSPRTMRRWHWRLRTQGYDGLLDRRRGLPSPRRAPVKELQRILRLYRDKYSGFNVRHFHDTLVRDHGVTLSYSFVKQALQQAGLVRKRRPRGRHFRRRPPRPCFGEMLHLDGSEHAWLPGDPSSRPTLVAVLDDATSRLLYAQLFPGESTRAVMTALRSVFQAHGLPMALYTDRAGWAAHTPKTGGPVDKSKLTQVGRALKRLGVEHILAYSPQARGRGERLNATLQDRLVNELRVARLRIPEAANRYLRERFIPHFNERFARSPADPASAFVPLGTTDLDQILCHEEQRTVSKDNTVVLHHLRLQLEKIPGRRTCAGLSVLVRRHLDGKHSIWYGGRRLGTYDAQGRPLAPQSQGQAA